MSIDVKRKGFTYYNIILVFIVFILLLFLSTTVIGSSFFNYNYELKYDSDLYPLNKLMKEDFLAPDGISDENISLYWKHEYILSNDDLATYKIAYFKEYERAVLFNKDIIELLANANRLGSMEKKSYKVQLQTWSQLLDGISLSKEIFNKPSYGLSVDLSAKLLRGIDLKKSYYNGEINYKEGELLLEAYRNSIYSFIGGISKLDSAKFYSKGYSFDINMNWKINRDSEISLNIEDFYSALYWYNVYTRVGKIKSNNFTVGEDGYLEFNPSTNKYYYDNYQTKLTPKINFSYANSKIKMGIRYRDELKPYFIKEIYNSKDHYNNPFSVKIGFWGDTYILKLRYSNINIELNSSDINLQSAKSIGGEVSLDFEF